jgi:asparagine synthase (glutamine-hydrolysing)
LEGAYSIDVDHPDMSEGRWQDYALGELDLRDKLRRIRLGPEDLAIDRLAAISVGLDYPLFHPNFVGSLLLTRSASENGLKVLLSGEGADELFLGYRWLFGSHPPSEFLEYIPLADIQALLGLAAAPPVSTDGLRLIEVFQKIYLQRWLLRQDLTGMANSVEVRVPFLALDVARLANSLSDCFKRGGGESKWLIKHILSRRFSKEFVERKKVGFDFPLNDWIGRDHFALVRQSGLVDPEVFDEIVRKREGTYMKNRIVFALTSLAVWYEQWSSRSS